VEGLIQPCAPCTDLYGQPVAVDPHGNLVLRGTGAVKVTVQLSVRSISDVNGTAPR